jgi:hypothetical protein
VRKKERRKDGDEKIVRGRGEGVLSKEPSFYQYSYPELGWQ